MANKDTIGKPYLLPRLEIILLDNDDVITTSGGANLGFYDNIGKDIIWEEGIN